MQDLRLAPAGLEDVPKGPGGRCVCRADSAPLDARVRRWGRQTRVSDVRLLTTGLVFPTLLWSAEQSAPRSPFSESLYFSRKPTAGMVFFSPLLKMLPPPLLASASDGLAGSPSAEPYLTATSVNEPWLPGVGVEGLISVPPLLDFWLFPETRDTLMSAARGLIEIWTWIIHAPLMSPGSLLTMNSRRVDLDVWARVGLIAAEVRTTPPPHSLFMPAVYFMC